MVKNSTIKILYEDNHIIVVYKPAGVLVSTFAKASTDAKALADRSVDKQKGVTKSIHDDSTLYWQIKSFIKERDKKPGKVFLGVLHRIDRPVSGIVLFAKTSKGAARLSEQFRSRSVKKIYYAVVEGKMEPSKADLIHHLQKNEVLKKSEISETGDIAELKYDTVKSGKNFSLLRIELKTGRFHQIRAQLAAAGHPIVGDTKYGAKKKNDDNSIFLSATEIAFTTATTKEVKNIKTDYPDLWDKLVF